MSEAQIKHGELVFQSMIEAVPNAIVLVNSEGRIAYINGQTEKLFLYPRAELVGQLIETLIPERFKKQHPGFFKTFFSNPEVRAMGLGRDLYAARRDGSEFPVEIGLNPLVTVDGTLVLASIIDISHRKSQEEIIKKQLGELEIKNKQLEQFVYIASHDLQEPLRTVTNFSSLLEEEYRDQLDEDAVKCLKFMSNAAIRMSALVKGLLDYSRIGNREQIAQVDCNTIVDEIQQDLAVKIRESNTTIDIAHLPSLFGYATGLRMLFQNLIVNAIKFREPDISPRIKIDVSKQGKLWQFCIQDNGIGIEVRHQDRIFEIFQRLHSTDKFEGTGIGLAHCKKIVELHGGSIWVDSTPGEGSAFYFTLKAKMI